MIFGGFNLNRTPQRLILGGQRQVLNQLYLHLAFLRLLFCIESLFSDGLGILACAVVGEDCTWLHPVPLVPVDVLP